MPLDAEFAAQYAGYHPGTALCFSTSSSLLVKLTHEIAEELSLPLVLGIVFACTLKEWPELLLS